VMIVTVAGEHKRFDMSEVEYASPASDAPSGADEQATKGTSPDAESDETVPVELQSPDEGIVFHLRTRTASIGTSIGVDEFISLCEAPCLRRLPRGRHTFGLSEGSEKPFRAEEALTIDGPSTVVGEYQSYAGLRTAGYILMFGGPVAGMIMIVASLNTCDPGDPECKSFNPVLGLSGAALIPVGLFTGYAMAVKSDEAEVRLAAGMTRTREPSVVSETSKRAAGLAPTLGLAGRF
jgi:hypothetical protein